jgi:hypothetical protein
MDLPLFVSHSDLLAILYPGDDETVRLDLEFHTASVQPLYVVKASGTNRPIFLERVLAPVCG